MHSGERANIQRLKYQYRDPRPRSRSRSRSRSGVNSSGNPSAKWRLHEWQPRDFTDVATVFSTLLVRNASHNGDTSVVCRACLLDRATKVRLEHRLSHVSDRDRNRGQPVAGGREELETGREFVSPSRNCLSDYPWREGGKEMENALTRDHLDLAFPSRIRGFDNCCPIWTIGEWNERSLYCSSTINTNKDNYRTTRMREAANDYSRCAARVALKRALRKIEGCVLKSRSTDERSFRGNVSVPRM